MANPLFKYLIKIGFAAIPVVKTARGRAFQLQSTLQKARSLGVPMPSARKALSIVRSFGKGVRTSSFNKLYKPISTMPTSIAKQSLLSWKARIPMSIIPEADFILNTKYLYKFRVNMFDSAQGTWSERYVSIGSDRKLNAAQAWQLFQDNYMDENISVSASFYKQAIDIPSVTFAGVWQTMKWNR